MFVSIWKYRKLQRENQELQAAYADLLATSVAQVAAFQEFRTMFENYRKRYDPVEIKPVQENVVRIDRRKHD